MQGKENAVHFLTQNQDMICLLIQGKTGHDLFTNKEDKTHNHLTFNIIIQDKISTL